MSEEKEILIDMMWLSLDEYKQIKLGGMKLATAFPDGMGVVGTKGFDTLLGLGNFTLDQFKEYIQKFDGREVERWKGQRGIKR